MHTKRPALAEVYALLSAASPVMHFQSTSFVFVFIRLLRMAVQRTG